MSDSLILERTQHFLSLLRHCQVLGMSVEHADTKGLTLCLSCCEKIVSNPESGLVHGGAITTLVAVNGALHV